MAGMTTRTMVAGGVAGLGLAIGGLAVATADDTDPPASQGQEQGLDERGGPGGHHGGPRGGGELAADLAEELGVTEEQVRDAWEAVRDADREALREELAAALAEELDLPQAEVEAALEKVRDATVAELRTEARERLVERLDDAVADDDLTAADKASVLKAFDAGVIGDGPGGFGFGKLGGHGPR